MKPKYFYKKVGLGQVNYWAALTFILQIIRGRAHINATRTTIGLETY